MRDLPWPGMELPSGIRGLESKSYKELKLENKVKAIEGRLNESECVCSALKEEIEDLNWDLCEANRIIRDLENRNSHIKLALAILGILFASSLICFNYQSNDLLISYYAASKNGLGALLANPLFHNIYGMKISLCGLTLL
jgi:hypothetical protein